MAEFARGFEARARAPVGAVLECFVGFLVGAETFDFGATAIRGGRAAVTIPPIITTKTERRLHAVGGADHVVVTITAGAAVRNVVHNRGFFFAFEATDTGSRGGVDGGVEE